MSATVASGGEGVAALWCCDLLPLHDMVARGGRISEAAAVARGRAGQAGD